MRAMLASQPSLWTEINGHRTRVMGTFAMGPTFASSGHVIATDLNFLRLFPDRSEGLVDIGLVMLQPGANPAAVRDAIDAVLPDDVRVLTREQFLAVEQAYWTHHLPIGFIFLLGSLLGLVVGAVIVYQILYTDVSDHLREYATLKAMGYLDRDLYSRRPGSPDPVVSRLLPRLRVGAAAVLRRAHGHGLPIKMTSQRTISVFVLTVVTCARRQHGDAEDPPRRSGVGLLSAGTGHRPSQREPLVRGRIPATADPVRHHDRHPGRRDRHHHRAVRIRQDHDAHAGVRPAHGAGGHRPHPRSPSCAGPRARRWCGSVIASASSSRRTTCSVRSRRRRTCRRRWPSTATYRWPRRAGARWRC